MAAKPWQAGVKSVGDFAANIPSFCGDDLEMKLSIETWVGAFGPLRTSVSLQSVAPQLPHC